MLNGWAPCPYARQARLNNEVDIRQGCYNPVDDITIVSTDQYSVIAYVYDKTRWTASEFNGLVSALNIAHLNKFDMIALADHPDDHEEVNGVCMNQGQYSIVFVQSLSKLNHFAKLLGKKGFYDGWDEEYLKVLFAGREDPRNVV